MMMLMQKWCKCAWAITVWIHWGTSGQIEYIQTLISISWTQNHWKVKLEEISADHVVHLLLPQQNQICLWHSWHMQNCCFSSILYQTFICYRTVIAPILTVRTVTASLHGLLSFEHLLKSQSLDSGHVFQTSNHYCYSCCLACQSFLRTSTKTGRASALRHYWYWVPQKDLQDVLQITLLLIYLCSVFSLLRTITPVQLMIYQNLQIFFFFFQTAFCQADIYPVFVHFIPA